MSFDDEKDEPQRRATDLCTCGHKALGHAAGDGACYGCGCHLFVPHPQPRKREETPSLQLLDWEGEFFHREAALAIAYREVSAELARFDSAAPTEAAARSLFVEIDRMRNALAALRHHVRALL